MASPVSACSSEFDSAETVAGALMNQINRDDVRHMVHSQRDMLSRFEKTNEMLINFNMLSANRFAVTSQEFKKHTEIMYEMKRDLDLIFKRIRTVKDRLSKTYPEAFKVCGNVTPLFEDDEDEEELVVKEDEEELVVKEFAKADAEESRATVSATVSVAAELRGATVGASVPVTSVKQTVSRDRDSQERANSSKVNQSGNSGNRTGGGGSTKIS